MDLPVDLHDPCYLATDEAFSLAPRRTRCRCGWGLVELVAGRSGVCYREEVVHASMLDAKMANKEEVQAEAHNEFFGCSGDVFWLKWWHGGGG